MTEIFLFAPPCFLFSSCLYIFFCHPIFSCIFRQYSFSFFTFLFFSFLVFVPFHQLPCVLRAYAKVYVLRVIYVPESHWVANGIVCFYRIDLTYRRLTPEFFLIMFQAESCTASPVIYARTTFSSFLLFP